MRVSIITAVLNGADVIGDTMNSIIAQDYPVIEHIVIDGASSDATLDVVRRHGARVAVVKSGRDGGVYEAFNNGLRAASGDVIAFLNAGDVYAHAGVVSRLMREFTVPTVDAVFGDLDVTSETNPPRVLHRYRSNGFTPASLPRGFMPAHPTLYLRRSVYDRLGGYDQSFRIAGDFEFCLRAFLKQQIGFRYVPEALVHMPTGGISNRGLASAWTVTREMHRACLQNNVDTSWFKLLMRLPIKALARVGFEP